MPCWYLFFHPRSSKSLDHFSIETHGDLGLLHFKKAQYNRHIHCRRNVPVSLVESPNAVGCLTCHCLPYPRCLLSNPSVTCWIPPAWKDRLNKHMSPWSLHEVPTHMMMVYGVSACGRKARWWTACFMGKAKSNTLNSHSLVLVICRSKQ